MAVDAVAEVKLMAWLVVVEFLGRGPQQDKAAALDWIFQRPELQLHLSEHDRLVGLAQPVSPPHKAHASPKCSCLNRLLVCFVCCKTDQVMLCSVACFELRRNPR